MATYVKVASVPFVIPFISEKPENMDIADFMIGTIKEHLKDVLSCKPDLIVLSEVCDRPRGMPWEDVRAYYDRRGNKVEQALAQIARENGCYIAAGLARDDAQGNRYNSCVMFDRKGNVAGYYDKNYIVPWETDRCGILPGKDITVFECDFGRVGAVICYDLNFEEMRTKYREANCDLIVFPTHFDGGFLCRMFAHETGAYFVNCYSGGRPMSAAYDPLGTLIAESTIHYPFIVTDLNLDYEILHFDGNKEKLVEVMRKYGNEVRLIDPGYTGTAILLSESAERTAKDIVKEFNLKTRAEQFAQGRAHRAKYI